MFRNNTHIMKSVNLVLFCAFLISTCIGNNDFAGTRDRFLNNANIVSLSISPSMAPTGTSPEITAIIQNVSAPNNGSNGKTSFDVVAVITTPDGGKKSLVWHDVTFSENQKKSYALPKSFENKMDGTYTISFFVYDKTRSHLYAQSAKTFTLFAPAQSE